MNRLPLLLAVALAATGCGDTTRPDPATGTLTAQHTGAVSGRYSAWGNFQPPLTGHITTREVVVAIPTFTSGPGVKLLASHVRADGKSDWFLLSIAALTGEWPLNCSGAPICAFAWYIHGYRAPTRTDAEEFDQICQLTTGTVSLDELSPEALSGTLSGAGTCTSGAGETKPWTVTNGRFRALISSDLDF